MKNDGISNSTLDRYGIFDKDEIDKVLTDYQAHLRRFNRSEKTIRNYIETLALFKRYVKKSLKDINMVDIDSFLTYLQEKGLESSTRSSYLTQIKVFYNYLHDHGVITINPVMDIVEIKVDKKKKVILTPKEYDLLLQEAEKSSRDEIIVKMLFDSLVRVSELVEIKKCDIDFNQGFVKIHGKGSKERTVVISDEFLIKIRDYCRAFKDDQKLFEYHTGTIQRDIRALGRRAGIKKQVTPHTLRRTSATEWSKSGGNLEAIRMQLGHENLSYTQEYVTYSEDDLKEEYKKHPSSRKTNQRSN